MELVCSKNPNLLFYFKVLISWGGNLTIVGGQPKTPYLPFFTFDYRRVPPSVQLRGGAWNVVVLGEDHASPGLLEQLHHGKNRVDDLPSSSDAPETILHVDHQQSRPLHLDSPPIVCPAQRKS